MDDSQRTPPEPIEGSFQQAMRLAEGPVDYILDLQQRHPEGFTLSTGILPDIHYLTRPADIAALAAHRDTLDAGRTNARIGAFDLAFGERSVVVLDGEDHERSAEWIASALALDRVLPRLSKARTVVRSELERLGDDHFDLYLAVRRLAARLVVELVLSPAHDDGSRLTDLLIELLDAASAPTRWLLERRRLQPEIDQLILRGLQARMEAPADDVVSGMLEARWPTPEDLLHNLRTLLVLGHEGSAAAVTWALSHLMRDDEARAAVAPEAKKLVGRPSLSTADIKATPKLGAVISETLRLTPPLVAVHRSPRCPVDAGAWAFDPGSAVGASMLVAHRDPSVWKDPCSFRPGRFTEGAGAEPGSLFPFGLEGRQCLGRFVAGFEVRVLLSEILEHFGDRLRPADADPPDFAMRGNILVPEGGLLVRQDEVRET